jgi:hypothetical protein
MLRRVVAVLLIVVGVLLSVISGLVHRDLSQTNSLFMLFPVELLLLPLGGAVAGNYLRRRGEVASAMLGVGVYVLIVASAVSTVYPLWLPSDNTVLGSALLAGIWAGVGANLALASAAVLAGWSASNRFILSGVGGVLAFLFVTAGGVVSPLFRLQVPLLSSTAVALSAPAIARAERRRLVYPLALALIGSAGTIAVLLARGPDDWASASLSLKLYSFPIVLITLGVSLGLMDVVLSRRLSSLDRT